MSTHPAQSPPPGEDVDEDILLQNANVEIEEDHTFDDEAAGAADADGDDAAASAASGNAAPKRTHSVSAKRQQERQLNAELRELKRKRMLKLEELKQEAESRKTKGAEEAASKKLDFLMKMAAVYSHFVPGAQPSSSSSGGAAGAAAASSSSSAAASLSSSAGAAAGRRAGKHAMTAKEEAEELNAEEAEMEQAAHAAVRLTKQPALLTGGTLREYQLEGLNWMINLHDNNISGILADEMGLGKTFQSIALVAYLKESRKVNGPHLILVPKSVLGNWAREFAKFAPSIRVFKLQAADKEERLRMVKEDLLGGEFDVCVTSFETFCIEQSAFKKFSWYYVIIDEAHRIKNENSVLAKRVRELSSDYRLLITGTPLQNNLHELWALLNFLLPDVFASSDDFDSWFTTSTDGSKNQEVVRKLHAILRPFLLRRLKSDVETSLPPKTETKLFIGLSALQKQWYKSILNKDSMALNQMGGPERTRLLNTLMQLRKVCNHPYLFDGAEPGPPYLDGPHIWENCGKMVLLDKLLPKLKAQGSRVLIFSQMTRMLDILEDYTRLKNWGYCRIDGNTSGEDRDRQMDAFNGQDSPQFLFLLSTRAGGLGINLYTADVVVLFDSDWNPQADLQAMDRAHRIGQKKPVRVFRLVTEGTVEEKIVERAERKLFLDAVVIQQGRLANADKMLSKGELMSMVKYGADNIFRTSESSSITDEDVDSLLAKGEERTRAASEKLKQDMARSVNSLASLDFSGKYDETVLLWGDSTEVSAADAGAFIGEIVPLGVRERRKIDASDDKSKAGGAAGAAAAARKSAGAQRPAVRVPVMHDFQFFDRKRVEELVARENEVIAQRRTLTNTLKDVKAREMREHKAYIRMRVKLLLSSADAEAATTEAAAAAAAAAVVDANEGPSAQSSSSSSGAVGNVSSAVALLARTPPYTGPPLADEAAATAAAEAEFSSLFPEGEESTRLEKELEAVDFTDAERAEKERLLSSGFADWTRRDLKALTVALERHGRTAREEVVREVHETTDRAIDEIKRYIDVFEARGPVELADWKRMEERIAKGEAKIRKREETEVLIAEKVARSTDPFRNLTIAYGDKKGGATMKGFIEEEDRFLVCMLNRLGYGAWDSLKAEIRAADQFRFDWFIKSRTTAELQRRCDTLIRLLEKEDKERRGAEAGGGGAAAVGAGGATLGGIGSAAAGAVGKKRPGPKPKSAAGDDSSAAANSKRKKVDGAAAADAV